MSTPLRLLLVTDAVGGVWTYSLELARALKPLGIETVLALMGPSPSPSQREAASGFKLIDTGLPLDWIDADAGEIRRTGRAVAAIADIEGVDVVQTCSAALLADVEFGQPCVAVQHSCVASWWAAVKATPLPDEFAWRRDLVEAGLHRAAAIVAPSVAFASETARLYDVEVAAVHNGRSAELVRALPQGDFVFTAARLWDEGKNAATLDAAAARLEIPFEAAGPQHGPNGTTIELRHMRTLGELGPSRVSGLLATRPIFASAALYEPFGLSVLEAALAGCPLILSDIATHREMWTAAAIFISPRDDAAFARAIQDLIDDPDERQQLGQLARARAQLYSPHRMARAMAEIYARVAAPDLAHQAVAGTA